MRGKITKIEFTFGGLGNQWTTIQEEGKEPVNYATWWDFRNFDGGIQVGAEVEFTPGGRMEYYIGASKATMGPTATITAVTKRAVKK